MTTLPQATSTRMARSAPSNLAIPNAPSPMGMSPYAANAAAGQMTGADAWRVIRANSWLIIFFLILSAGGGYGVNYWLNLYHARYTASGTVVVTAPTSFIDGARRTAEDYNSVLLDLETNVALLKDTSLIERVLADPNSLIRTTQWFRSFNGNISAAKADLKDYFEAGLIPNSRLISITMTGNDPRSCQTVVASIVEEFLKEQQSQSANKESSRLQTLQHQKDIQENERRLKDDQITEMQQKLNEQGITGTQNHISEQDMELEGLLSNRVKLELDLQTANEEYNTVEAEIAAGQDPPEVTQMIYQDPDVAQYREFLAQEQVKRANLTGGDTMINSPAVKSIDAAIDGMQKKLTAAIDDARLRYRTAVVEKAKQSVDAINSSLKVLTKRSDDITQNMTLLTDVVTQLTAYQQEKEQIEKRLEVIDTELDNMSTSSAADDLGNVDWAAKPVLPEIPSFPKLYITMPLAITLGLVLALGVAFLRELMDTSIRSPRDISRVGNMNLLGMIPHEDDDPQAAGARLPVVIFEAPHSMMAEQFRQVRTRMQHGASLDTIRTILVTSPGPGDGKSIVASNLASGLALNGRRILLVDANFRRPDVHRIFNLSNDQGFSDVLNHMDLFEHAVHETQVPNLYVLPTGPKPANGTELLESQLLTDFIERALEHFDHVIFDSGPLLFASETVALAPRVDGVVSVVRARANSRGVLSRMRDGLRQVKAEHLGIVLNAVRAQGGGYYGRNIRTYYEYQNGVERPA